MKTTRLITLIGLCWCCGCVSLVKPLGSVEMNDYPQSARMPLKYYLSFPSSTLDLPRDFAGTLREDFTTSRFELGSLFRYNVPAALDKVFLAKATTPEAADVRIDADLASFLAYHPGGPAKIVCMEMGIHYRVIAKDGHQIAQLVSITSRDSALDADSVAEGVKIMLATCLDDLNQKILRKKPALISLRQDSK